MKNTGIVRRVDDLGRVVLPKELRRTLNIHEGDPMEIYTDGEAIVLKKYEDSCTCGAKSDLVELKDGRVMCKKCIREFMNKLDKMD